MALVNFDIGGLFSGLIGLGKEFIEDKDKRNEFNMMVKEAENNLTITILEQKTTPFVDALVKLLYALKPFFRPIGSAALAGFGIYSYIYGVELPKEIQIMLFGSPVAWGYSRHIEKNKGK